MLDTGSKSTALVALDHVAEATVFGNALLAVEHPRAPARTSSLTYMPLRSTRETP